MPPRKAGRPLDEAITHAILAATLTALEEGGYAGLRVERIAAAVGCSKTTIYRRWPTRAELASDAVVAHSSFGRVPDHGDVVDDLTEHAWENALNQAPTSASPSARRILWTVIVEPEVLPHFTAAFLGTRREMGRTIVGRAIARGDVPADTDVDTLLDLIAGLTLYSGTIRGTTLTRTDYRRIITALCTAPPRVA